MTQPTRQDALDAANVFFTALNVILCDRENSPAKSQTVARRAASLRASMVCLSVADQMGVDFRRLERVATHLTRQHLPKEDTATREMMQRFVDELKDSQAMRN
ncbi:MAG: hypothetical protein KGZ25_16265 [Planctomycetes bacterium]|nr:hypothetical protein [Planctomycetota bacterium]